MGNSTLKWTIFRPILSDCSSSEFGEGRTEGRGLSHSDWSKDLRDTATLCMMEPESVNLVTSTRTPASREKVEPCTQCGRCHDASLCKFKEAMCHRCGKQGHIPPPQFAKPRARLQLTEGGNGASDLISGDKLVGLGMATGTGHQHWQANRRPSTRTLYGWSYRSTRSMVSEPRRQVRLHEDKRPVPQP